MEMSGASPIVVRHENDAPRERSSCGWRHLLLSRQDSNVAAWAHAVDIDGARPHYHQRATELYYVLEGSGHVLLDGIEHEVHAGSLVHIPPGVVHGAKGRMRVLVVGIPDISDADLYFPEEHGPPQGRTTASTFNELTDFLVALGTDKVPHTNEVFLAHLIGVYRDLQAWGCGDDVCRAGMFHSIYGTEKFQRFSLPLERRGEVRALIGQRAERLAYVNSALDRASFDRAAEGTGDTYQIADRLTGGQIVLDRRDFDDLCRVHLCDWLEQVPRSRDWNYRRAAYGRLARRLGGVAQEAYARVFAMESAEA